MEKSNPIEPMRTTSKTKRSSAEVSPTTDNRRSKKTTESRSSSGKRSSLEGKPDKAERHTVDVGEEGLELHDLTTESVKTKQDKPNKLKSRIERLLSKSWFRRLILVVAMVIETADLLADWFMFYDVYITDKGVVFGQVTASIKWCLLAISIIGTITFTVEMINLWSDLIHRREIIDGEIASTLNVWAEDVPHMLLNLGIAACRESATSYIQLAKASVILFASFMRIILTVIRYKMGTRYCKCKPATQRRLRIATVFGMVITFFCAVGVFLFSNLYPDANGQHKFHVPDTLWEDRFNNERYFKDVHIFATGPGIQTLCDQTSDTRWIRTVSLDNIIGAKGDGLYMQYDTDTGMKGSTFRVSTWVGGITISNDTYRVTNRTKCEFARDLITSPRTSTTSISVQFKFFYKPPNTELFTTSRLLLGDIQYAWKFSNKSDCIKGPSAIREEYGTLRYSRAKDTYNSSLHLVPNGSAYRMFVSNDKIGIQQVWKTGFFNCKTTGNTDPTFNASMSSQISCV